MSISSDKKTSPDLACAARPKGPAFNQLRGGVPVIMGMFDGISNRTKELVSSWLAPVCKSAGGWMEQYKGIFLILMLIQVVSYSYFYTTITLSNHTFPNAWLFSYPSYKTTAEGRWLGDMIVLAQGGSGVQSFLMICATMIQALNGILFARLLGLREKRAILYIAALFCMYPAFLDYYSFSVDQLTFVLGDTFALLGARTFVKIPTFRGRIVGASPLFLMAIASYQPKIALVSFLAAVAVLLQCTKTNPESVADSSPVRKAIYDAMAMVATVLLALGLYWLTTKLVITGGTGMRVHLNTAREIIGEIAVSYPKTLAYFTRGSAGVPHMLQFLPALGIVLGVTVILLEAWRKNAQIFFIVIVILALIPIMLRASYVINNQSWNNSGRIVAANGYCLIFFLGYSFRMKVFREISMIIIAVLLYFFVTLATQESNAAAFKTVYDTNIINRIAARAEMVLGAPTKSRRALVVAGHYPHFNRAKYVRHPYVSNSQDPPIVHFETFTFETYRQPQILNFFIGRDVFRKPTKDELKRALESAQNKPPWPSNESVYALDDILVMVLEPYRPDMPVTETGNK